MGKADVISGVFWFAFSAFVCYLSYNLGLGNVYQPGPGFFFFWTAVTTGVLSVAVIVRGFKMAAEEEKEAPVPRKVNLTKVVLVLAALFCYAMLLEWIGFIILTFLLFVFVLAFIEKKKWIYSVFIALVVTALAYLLFETALQSQLPKGLLESLRF